MCLYTLLSPICGHTTLYTSANCYLIYEQLQRINDPLYHTIGHLNDIPFDMPDACVPRRWNTRVVRTMDACGSVECANEMLGEAAVAERDYEGSVGGWRRGSLGGNLRVIRRRETRRSLGMARPGRVIGAEGARGGKRLGVGWRE